MAACRLGIKDSKWGSAEKYTCAKHLCNNCSIFEANEDTPAWVAAKRVGFANLAQKTEKR